MTRSNLPAPAIVSAGIGLGVAGSTVHAVWHDARTGSNEIYFNRSSDGGATWAVEGNLVTNGAFEQGTWPWFFFTDGRANHFPAQFRITRLPAEHEGRQGFRQTRERAIERGHDATPLSAK